MIMSERSGQFLSPRIYFVNSGLFLVLVIILGFIRPATIFQPIDYQTIYYGLASAALAFFFAGVIELRMNHLERKLDRLRATNRGCPRGHTWPVDACPFCRRDSHYL